MATYGYRKGDRDIVTAKVDSSTSTIATNDILTLATAGYVKRAGAGDTPCGIAIDGCAAPGSDGGTTIRMDVSPEAVYEYPADTGSVTQGLALTRLDVGGAQSIDIDATTDKVFLVVEVNITANTVLGRFTSLGLLG